LKRLTIGKHVVEWVAKQTNEFGNFGCAVGIGVQRFVGPHWEIVAGVVYNEFNGVNINMHVAALPGVLWAKPEYMKVFFDYPFNQAKVQRVTGLVGEGNLSARKFDEHVGFVLETTLERAHPTGRLLVYRMFREECKWVSNDSEKPYAMAA
jgi:hypothetical protein